MPKKNKVIEIPNIVLAAVILLFLAIIAKVSYVNIANKVDGIDIEEFALNRNTAEVLCMPQEVIFTMLMGKP